MIRFPPHIKTLKQLVREARRPFRPSSFVARRTLAQIREYEEEYGMKTSQMRRLFRHGQISDTEDTSRWLLLASSLPDWYLEGKSGPEEDK